MTKCLCQNCNQEIEIPNPVNVGEFSDSSGWKFIFIEEKTYWLCPYHKNLVEALSQQILDVVGDSFAYFGSLLPRKKNSRLPA